MSVKKKKSYDIFLSYRREGGFETSKHLYDLLTRDGYSVSFDIDTLRNGDFDVQLLSRIDICKDFIIILNKDVFTRTIDPKTKRQDDWVRVELAYALQKNKNIIPVMLKGFDPAVFEMLPKELLGIKTKNAPSYSTDYFDSFYEKLKEQFLQSKPQTIINNITNSYCAILKIKTDKSCELYIDDEKWGILEVKKITHIGLKQFGDINLKFVDLNCQEQFIEDNIYLDKDEKRYYTVNTSKWLNIVELEKKQIEEEERRQREAAERKRREEEERIQRETAERKRREKENWDRYRLNLLDGQIKTYREDLVSKYGFIDETGKEVIPCIYDDADSFSGGLANVKKDGKWGYIDKLGKEVIPCIYGWADSFSEGLASVKKDGKWGYIDKLGKEVIPGIYGWADSFSEGLASVEKDGKWGYIDKTGKEVIPCVYYRIGSFSEGLASVKKDGKYGYIDKLGKEVIPCIYDGAGSFSEGLARVEKYKFIFIVKIKTVWYIDKTGKKVKKLNRNIEWE